MAHTRRKALLRILSAAAMSDFLRKISHGLRFGELAQCVSSPGDSSARSGVGAVFGGVGCRCWGVMGRMAGSPAPRVLNFFLFVLEASRSV